MGVMIGHQREVLAQLGIDIWVSRNAVCQKMAQPSIWRDHTSSEIITHLTPQPEPVLAEATVARVVQPSAELHTVVAETNDQLLRSSQEQSSTQIADFSLQAIMLPHLVIVLDSTALNHEQQQLWANIQRAVQAEFFELNWPFILSDLHDAHAVENYIQGFIDVIAQGKLLISLGDIPHWQQNRLMRLASLAEMLQQPLLKRRLWNFIQNKQNVA